MVGANSSKLHAVLVEIASKNKCNLPVRGLGNLIDRDRELLQASSVVGRQKKLALLACLV